VIQKKGRLKGLPFPDARKVLAFNGRDFFLTQLLQRGKAATKTEPQMNSDRHGFFGRKRAQKTRKIPLRS